MGKKIFFVVMILTAFLLFSQVPAFNENQTPLKIIQEEMNNGSENKLTRLDISQQNSQNFAIASIAENITDDDAVMGNSNAPVTIVEFGGLEEPFSELFWNNTFPTIKSQYIDTEKVKFVFRDFPLDDLFPFRSQSFHRNEYGHRGHEYHRDFVIHFP